MIEGLNNKVVIVTGGGHGIGKAYCLGFAQAGSHIVVADIDKTAADQVSTEIIRQKGPGALQSKPMFPTRNQPETWLRPHYNVLAESMF
jgi:NAD(P)-dependent dehydrogenase (short-subunit alcohol dehydrogenase family)